MYFENASVEARWPQLMQHCNASLKEWNRRNRGWTNKRM